jgi:hypothetical protein
LSIKPGATALPSASIVRVRRAGELADLGDLAVLDPDIATETRHTRAIDHTAIFDQQIIRHPTSSSARRTRTATGSVRDCSTRDAAAMRAFAAWIAAEVCKTGQAPRFWTVILAQAGMTRKLSGFP